MNRMLKEEIFWKAKSIDGIDCFFIDITKAKSYYYDSLCWKIPPNLNNKENSSSCLLKIVKNVPLGAFFLKVFIVKKHTVGRPKNAIKSANKMILSKVKIWRVAELFVYFLHF